ncbi:MAG: NAD(P)H-dependent oxidoreductase [Runella sp.]
MAKNKILVLLFHPRLEDSRVNAALVKAARKVKGVTVRDMYELYPDFNIDETREQKLLLQHDYIVWQHPFYWYSCPPLMKQWIDLVLEQGWAYGKDGDKLKGKKLFHVISSGGNFGAYSAEGRNKYTYLELLRPFELTARLCQIDYLPPLIVPSANALSAEEIEQYASFYQDLLGHLVEEQIVPEVFEKLNYWNDHTFSTT